MRGIEQFQLKFACLGLFFLQTCVSFPPATATCHPSQTLERNEAQQGTCQRLRVNFTELLLE